MPLKTVVKVGNISNLSDARYCSGMGVDLLGFRVVEDQPNHISPKLFQEIRGWLSGPKIVAEIYGLKSPEGLNSIIENYAPEYFELSAPEFIELRQHLTLPCIVTGPSADDEKIVYQILDEGAVETYRGSAKLFIKPASADSVLALITSPKIFGVALNGAPELRPGFKDYADLAEILEKLDDY